MVAGIITVILLVVFVGGALWVYSPRRKPEFDQASRIPLEDQNEESK
jgi:cytochrome c oxidase cbb3-type subunit 4